MRWNDLRAAPGRVDEQLLARLVLLAHDQIEGSLEDPLAVAEQAVAIAVGVYFAVRRDARPARTAYLPKLLSPELKALRYAVDDDDIDAVDEHLEPALKQVDNSLQRASLARAKNKAIDPAVADVAIVDLDSHDASSLLRTSLLHALAVPVGASRTPSGLLIVSR